jgi:hypothetical protein
MIIRRVLAHINKRLGKRARYSLYDGSKLVIKYCVGDYREDIHINREIVRESVVWKAFGEGKALNFTNPSETRGYEHTLQEQIKIKAAVPLRYVDARTHQEVKFGILVVDSGKEGTPISAEEFEYLLLMADLVGETVGKAELVRELIDSYEKRQELIITMADYLRNRFMVIGGFARRLHKKLRGGEEKGYARIIFNEVEKLEERLQTLEGMFKRDRRNE